MLFAIVILAFVGATSAGMGYAIKYRRRYHLIAGFDRARVSDPDALARWTGNRSFVLAAICAAGVIALLVMPGSLLAVLRTVSLASVVVVLVTVSSAMRRKW